VLLPWRDRRYDCASTGDLYIDRLADLDAQRNAGLSDLQPHITHPFFNAHADPHSDRYLDRHADRYEYTVFAADLYLYRFSNGQPDADPDSHAHLHLHAHPDSHAVPAAHADLYAEFHTSTSH